jgi:hypothetical protein
MNFEEITYKYYSKWLGSDYTKLHEKGVFLIYNPERNIVPPGYSQTMDIYIFIKNDLTIVSYGDRAKEKTGVLNDSINSNIDIESVKKLFESTYTKKTPHSIKYLYKNIIENKKEVIILNENHWTLYIDFFKANNPNCGDYSWVKEYFLEMVSKKYSHGIMVDKKFVSVTDAPDMPYMKEYAQEIGINTLNEYRGKGYAKEVCLSLIKELLSKNICPMWSTGIDNSASDRLAKSTGFEKLADILTMSL